MHRPEEHQFSDFVRLFCGIFASDNRSIGPADQGDFIHVAQLTDMGDRGGQIDHGLGGADDRPVVLRRQVHCRRAGRPPKTTEIQSPSVVAAFGQMLHPGIARKIEGGGGGDAVGLKEQNHFVS